MKDKTLFMIGNAHIDPVWLWQWQEGFHEVKATFRSALDRMKECDDFIFVSSSAAFYEWVEENEPEMFEEIRQRVAEGRWRLVGGWWVQPDCNIPSGESFARQALYAQHYFKEKFNQTAEVGYNVDSFGHNGMLPQILKKSGLNYYVFMRPMPHEKGLPARLFWWESGDGSRVLAYRLPFEYCTWGKGLETHVQHCAAELKTPFDSGMCFYGVGNHGGGPTIENLESIRKMKAASEFPELVFASPEDFFRDAVEKGVPVPVVHDELQHHASGCYSAHSGVKRWNRKAENLLAAAEKWSALASWETGQPYPAAEFKRAWKNVLFNQFHDILAGTSLEEAYDDARDQYGEAMSIAARAYNNAVQSIAWRVRTEPEEGMTPIVVFNPHGWASKTGVELEFRSLREDEILLDETDRVIPVQVVQSSATAKGRSRIAFLAELPPLGYRTYRLVRASLHPDARQPAMKPLQGGDTWMENSFYRLEFDPDSGAIKSLYDKREGIEVLAGPGAMPVVIDDNSDTWSHNVFSFNQAAGCFKAKSIRMTGCGPVKAIIRVVSEWGASELVQEFSLYRDREGIDVKARVNWQEKRKMLKLRFPLNLSHMNAVSEIPYGHIVRFAGGEEEPCQSWVDVSGLSRANASPYGLSLLNDGKYSFDINIREIGLTVLRSPVYAHHVPMEPEADGVYAYLDQGIQRFQYTILPHPGSWEKAGTVKRAAELNQPPFALVGTYHPEGTLPQSGSYASVDVDHVVLTVLKQAEEPVNTAGTVRGANAGGDLIVRCVEMHGEAGTATICLPKWRRTFTASFGPCEIKTFRIPCDHGQPVVETNLLEWVEESTPSCDQEQTGEA